jgi:hypothetical protein
MHTDSRAVSLSTKMQEEKLKIIENKLCAEAQTSHNIDCVLGSLCYMYEYSDRVPFELLDSAALL